VQPGISKRFLPAAWHEVYHRPDPTPSELIFRRVTDEVYQCARPLIQANQRWIDIGCGTGELSNLLGRSGSEVISIDLDPAMLLWTEQNLDTDLAVHLLAANATKIPCGNNSAHGVVAASLTGCLDDLDSFFKEISRVLITGGHAIISFTNRQSMLLRLVSQWRRIFRIKDNKHPCYGRFNRYQVDEVARIASTSHFQVISISYINCYADFGIWSFPSVNFARKLESVFPRRIKKRMCRSFVIMFQKTI
jgi:SAM-dependent methyltransferase